MLYESVPGVLPQSQMPSDQWAAAHLIAGAPVIRQRRGVGTRGAMGFWEQKEGFLVANGIVT